MLKSIIFPILFFFTVMTITGCSRKEHPKYHVGDHVWGKGYIPVTITSIEDSEVGFFNDGISYNLKPDNPKQHIFNFAHEDELYTSFNQAKRDSDMENQGFIADKIVDTIYLPQSKQEILLTDKGQWLNAQLFGTRVLIKAFETEMKDTGPGIVFSPQELSSRMQEIDSTFSEEVREISDNLATQTK